MCEGKGARQKPYPVLCLRSHTKCHYIPVRYITPLCSSARPVWTLHRRNLQPLNPGPPRSCLSSTQRRMISCSLWSTCWFRNQYLFILSECSLFFGRQRAESHPFGAVGSAGKFCLPVVTRSFLTSQQVNMYSPHVLNILWLLLKDGYNLQTIVW